jgi:DNA-binding transcriptional ArsR family regulator
MATSVRAGSADPTQDLASQQDWLAQGDCDIAAVASLMADTTRATILLALLDQRIRPAGELARIARVTPATASEHLTKLVAGGLVAVEPQGRFRYYRLAHPALAEALEALAAVAPPRRAGDFRERQDADGIRRARLCYDHVAGLLGVQITEALVADRALVREDRAFLLGDNGLATFADLGIDVAGLRRGGRLLGRACLDWNERRYHLAGPLGRALASRLLELSWIERVPQSRGLRVTNAGRRALQQCLGVRVF